MYKWNKQLINEQIKYLQSLNINDENIEENITMLKNLKTNILGKVSLKEELQDENETYNNLKKYNNLLNIISNKHIIEADFPYYPLKTINSSKKDILLFTQDMIYSINKKWYNTLLPIFNDTDILKYQKNILNFTIYIPYLRQSYISLSKENTITDYIIPTHEYLHIYYNLLNIKNITKIEDEFLSILGELIICYEMKQKNMFHKDTIEYSLNNHRDLLFMIHDTLIRKEIITKKIPNNKKINYLKQKHNCNKIDIKDIYSETLTYNYSCILSYYIALELFYIYLEDKEKCMYICDQLIIENDFLAKKLKRYNIKPLCKEDKYIKTLKKEYESINNQ